MQEYNLTLNGMGFSNKQPMKGFKSTQFLSSIEDIARYAGDHVISGYYPIRFQPAIDIDRDKDFPIVMAAGDIVAIEEIKNNYTSDDDVTGIRAGNEIYLSQDATTGDPLKNSINFIYKRDMAGFVTKANGGVDVTDKYSQMDIDSGVLKVDGTTPTIGDDFVRPANVAVGIVQSKVVGDIRERFLNYAKDMSATAISQGGYLDIPYIIVSSDEPDNNTVKLDAIKAAITSLNDKHQYVSVFVNNDSALNDAIEAADIALKPGAYLKSNEYGKFTNFTDSDDANQKFGKIINKRNRGDQNLDEITDSFPGSGIQGMDTGGLSSRDFDFMSKILTTDVTKPDSFVFSKPMVKSYVGKRYNVDTNISIELGKVTVAYGQLIF